MSVTAAPPTAWHGHASNGDGDQTIVSESTDSTASAASAGRRRSVWSWLVQLALVAAAIGSVALLRDELPDVGDIWRAAAHSDPGWLVVVIFAEAASMAAFARLQRRLLRTGGTRVSLGRALAVTYAANSLSTTLPAGPAVSVVYAFRQWRRAGASAPIATAVVVMGGVITTTAYSVIALLTLLVEPHSRFPAALGLAVLAVAAAVLVPLCLRRRSRARLLRALRGPVRRARDGRFMGPLVRAVVNGLRQARGVVRLTPRDIGALTALAVLNWVFDILALAAACRALDLDVAPYAVAVAYFAAQAAGSLFPLLPGGLGAIEGGMTATLVAFGAGGVPAGAAVGLYRVVSFWGVVAAGWLAWLGLWVRDNGHRPVWPRWRAGLLSGAQQAAFGFAAAAGVAACLAPSAPAAAAAPALTGPPHVPTPPPVPAPIPAGAVPASVQLPASDPATAPAAEIPDPRRPGLTDPA